MGPSRTVKPLPRKTAYACEGCRLRKRRCDGTRPRCGLCEESKVDCVYKVAASRKYVDALENQTALLRDTLLKIVEGNEEERATLINSLDVHSLRDGRSTMIQTTPEPSHTTKTSVPSDDSPRHTLPTPSTSFSKDEPRISSIDGDQKWSLHGPSSLFYLSSSTPVRSSPSNATDYSPTGEPITEALDIQHQLFLGWIDSIAVQAEVPDISESTWHYLLQLHWTWTQPVGSFVHREAFLRDMRLPLHKDSLFSPFLLYALCAKSVRPADLQIIFGNRTEETANYNPFLRQARLLVSREVERGSNLSSLQGLLLLSAKECSLGRVSQAWMYLGIAVRMLQDLGIHLDGREESDNLSLSRDDREKRQHSFWSAYLWDKLISMYIGRVPMLQASRFAPSCDVDDPVQENELWVPAGSQFDEFPPYVPAVSHAVSTFSQMCRLSCIINDILLYDAAEPGAPDLASMRARLQSWWDELPPFLKINVVPGVPVVHPPHINNLNALYHMVCILLDRRLGNGEPSGASVTAAMAISVLVQYSHSLFKDRAFTLSHCYCLYTATTVFMYFLHVRLRSPSMSHEVTVIAKSLQWNIDRLREAARTHKVLLRPLSTLNERMSELTEGDVGSALSDILTVLPNEEGTGRPESEVVPPAVPQYPSQVDLAAIEMLEMPVADIPSTYDWTSLADNQVQPFWHWIGGGEMAGMDPLDADETSAMDQTLDMEPSD